MKNRKKLYKACCHIVFGIYLIFLVKIVLFKYKGSIATIDSLIAGELSGFRSFNIIPFRSIWEFTKLMFSGHFSRGFQNVVGNVLVFAPLGYFIPLLHKNCRTWKTVGSAGFFVSLLFETCQYVLYLGSADIDDIILNVLGAALGFLFYKGMIAITYKKETKRYAATVLLSIVGFLVASHLAVDYFGIMFGIEKQGVQDHSSDSSYDLRNDRGDHEKIEIVSDEQPNEGPSKADPDDGFDMYGNITAPDASSVTVNKVKTEDLGEGKGIASMSIEKPDLQTVYMTETTKYIRKDIYDVNGSRVETREGEKSDLEIDKNIEIKGYRSDDKLYADEIVIENFLFQ